MNFHVGVVASVSTIFVMRSGGDDDVPRSARRVVESKGNDRLVGRTTRAGFEMAERRAGRPKEGRGGGERGGGGGGGGCDRRGGGAWNGRQSQNEPSEVAGKDSSAGRAR